MPAYGPGTGLGFLMGLGGFGWVFGRFGSGWVWARLAWASGSGHLFPNVQAAGLESSFTLPASQKLVFCMNGCIGPGANASSKD